AAGRWRCAGPRRRVPSSASSPATAGSSSTSWPRKCSAASRPESGSSWPGLLSSAGSARRCATPSPGRPGSAEIMGMLEREDLFVGALAGTRQGFRYHHLFAQVLRSELARTEPDIAAALHQRASAWHRRSGSADEAISHARAAGDAAGVIDLIAAHWYAYVDSGRVATVRGWLASLGDGIVSAHPVAAH